MSVDQHYNIVFKKSLTPNMLGDIVFKLIDALGVNCFGCESEKGILDPVLVIDGGIKAFEYPYNESEKEKAICYQVSPSETKYEIGYERGDFWTQFYLMKFFLEHEEVKAVFRTSDNEYLGSEIDSSYVDELLSHYLKNGHFIREQKESFTTPNNPIHPDCICGKKLIRTSNSDEMLNFTCTARHCNKGPVRLRGKEAKRLLLSGELPSEYERVKEGSIDVWVPKTQAGISVLLDKFKSK